MHKLLSKINHYTNQLLFSNQNASICYWDTQNDRSMRIWKSHTPFQYPRHASVDVYINWKIWCRLTVTAAASATHIIQLRPRKTPHNMLSKECLPSVTHTMNDFKTDWQKIPNIHIIIKIARKPNFWCNTDNTYIRKPKITKNWRCQTEERLTRTSCVSLVRLRLPAVCLGVPRLTPATYRIGLSIVHLCEKHSSREGH